MLERVDNMSVINGYEGLDAFSQYAAASPTPALQIVWTVLTRREDPGRDDGALCVELLRLVGRNAGRQEVEKLLLSNWNRLPPAIQRNFIYGFVCPDVISIECACSIFDFPNTSVRERHLIVSVLASARETESPDTLLRMANRIGRYPDPDRQRVLEEFLASLFRGSGGTR